jgi:hypothetical protein
MSYDCADMSLCIFRNLSYDWEVNASAVALTRMNAPLDGGEALQQGHCSKRIRCCSRVDTAEKRTAIDGICSERAALPFGAFDRH